MYVFSKVLSIGNHVNICIAQYRCRVFYIGEIVQWTIVMKESFSIPVFQVFSYFFTMSRSLLEIEERPILERIWNLDLQFEKIPEWFSQFGRFSTTGILVLIILMINRFYKERIW